MLLGLLGETERERSLDVSQVQDSNLPLDHGLLPQQGRPNGFSPERGSADIQAHNPSFRNHCLTPGIMRIWVRNTPTPDPMRHLH